MQIIGTSEMLMMWIISMSIISAKPALVITGSVAPRQPVGPTRPARYSAAGRVSAQKSAQYAASDSPGGVHCSAVA